MTANEGSALAISDALALGDKYRAKPNELTDSDVASILKLHNDARARYGVAPLQWDDGLASAAKQWADTCYWGHWRHPDTRAALGADYFAPSMITGENLSVWYDSASTKGAGAYGTQLWLGEEKDYQCPKPVSGGAECVPGTMCGHWTQLLWSGTQRVGCALRTCADGIDERSWDSNVKGYKNVKYLVCEYSPPGNVGGQAPISADQCSQPGLQTGATQQPAIVGAGGVGEEQDHIDQSTPEQFKQRFRMQTIPGQSAFVPPSQQPRPVTPTLPTTPTTIPQAPTTTPTSGTVPQTPVQPPIVPPVTSGGVGRQPVQPGDVTGFVFTRDTTTVPPTTRPVTAPRPTPPQQQQPTVSQPPVVVGQPPITTGPATGAYVPEGMKLVQLKEEEPQEPLPSLSDVPKEKTSPKAEAAKPAKPDETAVVEQTPKERPTTAPVESVARPPVPEPSLGPPLRYAPTVSPAAATGYALAGAVLLGLLTGFLYFYFAEFRKAAGEGSFSRSNASAADSRTIGTGFLGSSANESSRFGASQL